MDAPPLSPALTLTGSGLVLLGAGGHARVLLAALAASGRRPVAAIEREGVLVGSRLDTGSGAAACAVPILPESALPDPAPAGMEVVVGVGVRPSREDAGTDARRRLHDRHAASGFRIASVLDPSAILRGAVTLASGSQVLAGAVLQPGASVGIGAVVNSRTVVEHDAEVGDHAFVAPGAVLCGGAVVGCGAFIGAGAIVLPGVRIGAGAVVPAGTTQRRDLASRDGR